MSKPDVRIVKAARLQHAKNFPPAEQIYRQILQQEPLHPDALFLLGLLLHQTARHKLAVDQLRRAIAVQPSNPDFHQTLLDALKALGRADEAIQQAQALAALQPNSPDRHFVLAGLLQAQSHFTSAIQAYTVGLTIAPQNDIAQNNLGTCYILIGRPDLALQCFQAAARLKPDVAEPLNNIGAALLDLGRLDDAIAAFEETRQLHPSYADASNNLGNCYSTIGEHEKAIAAYRQALAVRLSFSGAHSNLLMCMLYPPSADEHSIYKEHLAWDRQHAHPVEQGILPHQNDFIANRRLRIGYVSPDFREHSVRYFIEPILASHDQARFEVFCYAAGARRDEVTTRLRSLSTSWHDVGGLSDSDLAELIRSHQIDILIDLAGHTSDHRLLTFARKPAPVQITYLGYPTTTGLAAMDYRLTDSITDPPNTSDEFHREQLIRLPDAFFVYGDDRNIPYDPRLPADANGFITFGSFNNFSKISAQALMAWARILTNVPKSRLLMKTKALANPSTRSRVLEFFNAHDIAADRLDLRAWIPLADHMRLLGAVDLTLDTFPYNGHTTSCQSLWMGAPFITLAGNSFRSRVGASILHHLGLPDLIASSQEQYIQLASGLANERARLRKLRSTLRQHMLDSALTDAARFTAGLENMYGQLWERRCAVAIKP